MKVKQILLGTAVLGLVLALTWGPGLAQGPEERTQPPGTLSVEAVVNSTFTYQGMLREDGEPVTGKREIVFRLFSDDACTAPVGDEIPMPSVMVDGGLFSVELSVSPAHFDGQGLWLGIQVMGTAVGCQEILPVPYALSLRPGARVEGEQTGWDAIHVENTATTGASYGVSGWSHSTQGMGLYGYASAATGTTRGVMGRSASSSGRGVEGYATAISGTTYGVYGSSTSTSGTGVYGLAAASSGATYGVYGESASSSGKGLYGLASATSGTTYGVRAESSSTSGLGVYGYASAATGTTRGVMGRSASSSGQGVMGYASAASGTTYGVSGRSDSTSGIGVYGYASAASGATYGVEGKSSSPSGAGVLATGVESGADLILGGNSSSQDNGTIYSDPAYPSSDIVLGTNDTVRIDLDQDGDGEDADFEIRDKDNNLIFNVDESGDVTFGGTGVRAFPRPAYDSGWVSLGLGEFEDLAHNLGGNTDNYVVDMTCRGSTMGVSNRYLGGEKDGSNYYGAWWWNLTTSTIAVTRRTQDVDCSNVRIRIWVYP
jgi:hypothetical protein